jgi:hypothetical protein
MLTHFRRNVSLSMASTDMPVWSTIETTATLYQPEHDRYHLLITEPHVSEPAIFGIMQPDEVRLIWMELSSNQVVMTMQGNGNLSYRHFWETGKSGVNRYWIHQEPAADRHQLQLRNFTHSIELLNESFPNELHLDYELWSAHTRMGRYVMHLEIGN